ncbi:DUF6343 family protein [Streptomyces halobius]|uniref:DUF6343 family protein n=1 Tax=Streptomyces halobius TaxID=2879846 RepID=A0ABY4M0J9_9ACTN|nr:DUF6343 family protein [Streptomyces halobius]UQA90658.1 DUF6343 family protein [Streptomyces halobius]
MKRPRTGTEPLTARSALRLRLILAAIGLVAFTAGTFRFAIWTSGTTADESPGPTVLLVLTVVCGVLALTAALDLVVVLRRLRRKRSTAA